MMKVLNLTALIVALTLSLVAVAGSHAPAGKSAPADKSTPAQKSAQPNIPAGGFQRIASLGIVSDAALAALCEPGRVVAVSAWNTGPVARLWAGKPRLAGLDDLESVIALAPDLVLVSSGGGDLDRLARLRAAGLRVETLEPMRGLATYTTDLARIGELLERGPEARLIGQRLTERLARLAQVAQIADPAAPRPRALYVAAFSGTLFGGTVGTSYHDVLVAAGCTDAGEQNYSGWPQFSVEQVLALRPEIIVTKRGMAGPLQALPGMAALAGTRFIEIEGALLEDPGPRLLEAAEALHQELHPTGDRPSPADPNKATAR